MMLVRLSVFCVPGDNGTLGGCGTSAHKLGHQTAYRLTQHVPCVRQAQAQGDNRTVGGRSTPTGATESQVACRGDKLVFRIELP